MRVMHPQMYRFAAAQNTTHTCVWRHTQPTRTRFSRPHTCARPAACRTSHMKSVFGPMPGKPGVLSPSVPQTWCKRRIARSNAAASTSRSDSCAHRECDEREDARVPRVADVNAYHGNVVRETSHLRLHERECNAHEIAAHRRDSGCENQLV